MGRRRDDEDDRYEDRDREPSGSGAKTVMIVLGIVGGLVVLGVIGCIGFFAYFVSQATGTIKGMVETTTNATQFVQHFQGSRFDAAYGMTSSGYQARVSKAEFEALVKKHPLLTTHKQQTMTQTNLPNAKTQPPTASFTMSLSDRLPGFGTPDAMNEDEDEDMRPGAVEKPKVPKPVPPKLPAKDPPEKKLSLTIKMIEENGKWVIDEWIVNEPGA